MNLLLAWISCLAHSFLLLLLRYYF